MCRTVKLGDLDGQCKSTKEEIWRPGNSALRISVVGHSVRAVAPSCWKHIFSSPNSFSGYKRKLLFDNSSYSRFLRKGNDPRCT